MEKVAKGGRNTVYSSNGSWVNKPYMLREGRMGKEEESPLTTTFAFSFIQCLLIDEL
jgi:hypothetical protein